MHSLLYMMNKNQLSISWFVNNKKNLCFIGFVKNKIRNNYLMSWKDRHYYKLVKKVITKLIVHT